MTDVAELLHGRVYDPQKAHEYYVRNRQLKGHTPGSLVRPAAGGGSGPRATATKPRPVQSHPQSQSVQAQRAALEARLEHLKEVLRAKVADAKRRSGVKEPSSSSSSSSTSKSSSSSSKSGGSTKESSSSTKSDKPTASERNTKNRKAREAYQKDKPPSMVELEKQIASIRKQIQSAIEQSRKRHAAQNVPRTPGGSHQTADSRR